MKIITANGKKQVKISKKEWESIGKKKGWMKVATNWDKELSHSENVTLEIDGVERDVDVTILFDFDGGQKQVLYPADNAQPSYPPEVTINQVLYKGVNIKDRLSLQNIDSLEGICWDWVMSHDNEE